ncbi:barstar family protein [Streptomyces sp. RG80]|uniref:barstar family protein n=1 Tax=Streptomyces sp. RG80 TaxID=3157340 RepID=UPI00338E39F1
MTETVVAVDLEGVVDKAGLMDRCARDLRLPDWFGRNWDALADVLSDPGLWPRDAVDREPLVVVRNWRSYAALRPDEWAVACEVFAGAAVLTVALALGGSSEAPSDLPG